MWILQKHVGCKTILHEKYDVKNIANGYDIALLVLNTTSTKPPIEIVESTGRKAKGKVRAMGWGTDGKKKILDKLQEVDLRVVNNKECGEQIFPGILGSMMCAQGNSSDVCKGECSEQAPYYILAAIVLMIPSSILNGMYIGISSEEIFNS